MFKIKTLLAPLASALLVAGSLAIPDTALAQAAPTIAAAPAAAPTPTVDQRLSILEAYLTNSDPTVALKTAKDKDGNPALPEAIAKPDDFAKFAPTAGSSGPGHTGWMMTAAALVLFMTLPGLALFYGGLVREKNVLSVLAMCFGIAGMVTIIWWAVGYSLVFGKSFGSPFLGGTEAFFLNGVTSAPNTDYAYWIPQNVFCIYQLTFAIITPALIFGATAERFKFIPLMVFTFLWMFVVYFPLAHMVWGSTGLMNGVWNADAKIPAIDFAGGTVVHMSSGWTALIVCMILGKRIGFGKEPMPPHSMVLCMVGTGMLWVGWYGFNAGSALAADGVAANAFLTTTLATGVASFVWAMAELIFKGKPSVLGFCSGAVAGLVVITPACGFVNASGAVIIGIAAGIVPFFAVTYLKKIIGYDDALDTFGVHAVGGTMGAFLTGVLVDPAVNSNLVSDAYAAKNGLKAAIAGHTLWITQLEAIGVTLVLAIVGATVLGFAVKFIIGLRPSQEDEFAGLDISDHGEEGYILNK